MNPTPVDRNALDTTEVVLLLELPGVRWNPTDARRARQRIPGIEVDILTAVSEDETWMYFPCQEFPEPDMANDPALLLAAMLDVAKGEEPEVRTRHLHGRLTIGDPAEGSRQRWHYTSQTDIPAKWEEEFNQWFDEEHLPHLAAVPGTVHAARYETDGSPRFLACYDLNQQKVQGGSAWRAAVSTPWRDRIHKEFLNPRRLMLMRF